MKSKPVLSSEQHRVLNSDLLWDHSRNSLAFIVNNLSSTVLVDWVWVPVVGHWQENSPVWRLERDWVFNHSFDLIDFICHLLVLVTKLVDGELGIRTLRS